MSSDIPFIRPTFPTPQELADDFAAIVDSNRFSNFGPVERRLSAELAAFVDHGVVATTSANGTLALIAAIHTAIGRGDGRDYVLVPAFTFVAPAQAAEWTGHRPLFIDIDRDTWQPDVASARRALDSADAPVKGIVLANVFGVGNPLIADWEQLAADRGLPLVIDSAAGFGSWYDDAHRVGVAGTCEIFSLHATKPFAVGEGGAVLSKNPELIRDIDRFANFGFDQSRSSVSFGMNGKLSELAAAIGVRQLQHLDHRLAERRKLFDRYRAELGDRFGFQVNAERSSLCFASLRCTSVRHKRSVLAELGRSGIEARDYYNPPLHRQPWFTERASSFAAVDLPVTDDLCERIISVPIHDDMDEVDVVRILDALSSPDVNR